MTVDPLGIDWRSVEGRMAARQRLIAAERENETLRYALQRVIDFAETSEPPKTLLAQMCREALSSD